MGGITQRKFISEMKEWQEILFYRDIPGENKNFRMIRLKKELKLHLLILLYKQQNNFKC